jgi:two-component system, chemotaxis family, chemotaxis protein CheY
VNNRILLIDDDVMVRQTIANVLIEAGYDVVSCGDGVAGMRAYHRSRPDLVITDIIMPDQEGIQTLMEIHKVDPSAKVIAISGGGRTSNLRILDVARTMGATDTLAKPFDLEELLTVVRRWLPLGNGPASNGRP